MKTSKKLLIGLIAFIFLLITLVIGAAKFYQISKEGGFSMEETSNSSIQQMEPTTISVVYFPVTLLLPLWK